MRRMGRWLSAATGPGLGLWLWCGVITALLHLRAPSTLALQQLQIAGLGLGAALVALGAAGTWFGVRDDRTGPLRGRALRGRVHRAPLAAGLVALVLLALLERRPGPDQAPLIAALGAVLAVSALAATAFWGRATDRARARDGELRLPIRLLVAMSGGLALLALVMDVLLGPLAEAPVLLVTLTGLGAALTLCVALDGRNLSPADARPRRRTWPAVPVVGPLAGLMLVAAAPSATTAALALACAALMASAAVDHVGPAQDRS